eukprot:jgi/Mesvir1/27469/Mv07246-RA.1
MVSLLAMPFLIMNLGGEMSYILEQRLRAQSIPGDKSSKVVHDVVKAMYASDFVTQIFKAQEMYVPQSVRAVFEKLAHSSIMRLSESSMDKLYDLMTMGFKYQVSYCTTARQIVEVTAMHLSTIRAMLSDPGVLQLVDTAKALLDKTYNPLSQGDMQLLRHTLLRFFQGKRIKVSLFLQEGLQNQDGRLVLPKPAPNPGTKHKLGSVRVFDESGGVKESQVTLCTPPDATLLSYPVPLGGNLYAKDRIVKAPEAEQPGADAGGAAPAAGGATQARSMPAASSTGDGLPTSERMGPDDYVPQSKEATQELNLLASLIGGPKSDASSFKINLFPDTNSSNVIPSGGKSAADNMIIIDATCGKGKGGGLEDVMKSMELEDTQGESDDLLSLMDSAK